MDALGVKLARRCMRISALRPLMPILSELDNGPAHTTSRMVCTWPAKGQVRAAAHQAGFVVEGLSQPFRLWHSRPPVSRRAPSRALHGCCNLLSPGARPRTWKMIRNMLAAAGLVALMIGTANAEPKTKLPKAFLGEWCFDAKTETYRRARCRQSDRWLNVRPAGFSAHETDCTLQSASPNRSGEYRTQFECRGEGMIWTAYYWIGLDARDPRRLFLNETDSTFTKTEPDPSERNERPQ